MAPTDFATEVLAKSASIPVLVDFWAPWCAPCRALTPILEQAAERHQDRFVLVKVNTEEQPEIANQYQVRGIPNVKLFVDGQVFNEFTGALSAEMLEDWLSRALPSPMRRQLLEAAQRAAEGDAEEALPLLDEILASEPDNQQAAVLWAKLQLAQNPAQAAAKVARIGVGSDFFAEADAVRTLARLIGIADQAQTLAEGAAKDAYLKAAEALKRADYDQALDGFIGVVRSARSFDDDGARKACVALFNYLGDDHELTRKYRGLLSRALYV